MPLIQLSTIAPDWGSLVTQLQTASANYPAWSDRLTTSTGQTFVEMIAAIGAYSQFAIESSFQEAFPESAKNPDSLYAAANYAGVRVPRKAPAALQLQMTSVTPIVLPTYSQFIGAGVKWFNNTSLSLSSTPTTVTLYEGEVINKSIYGGGTDFQAFVTTEKGFVVGDTDVVLKINSMAIPITMRGLWTQKDQPAAQQFTLPDGRLILLFGNDIYGSKPGANDLCEITYIVTSGADGNNIVTIDKTIALDGDPTIKGVAAQSPSGGANEQDYLLLKNLSPALFGSFDAAVTPAQYKALPLLYPGVIDAQVYSQREINPKALTWMNNMKVVLLTESEWGTTTKRAFTAFLNERSQYKSQYILKSAMSIDTTVDMDVYCANFSNLLDIKARVEAAIQDLFSLRQGILGFDFYKTDITSKAKRADGNIEYIVLNQPSTDIVLSSLNVDAPTVVSTTGVGGSLPSGKFDYAVSAVMLAGGETSPANWTTVDLSTGSNTNTLTWAPVVGAVFYKIWGRTTGVSLGLLKIIAASAQTYADTGADTPSGTVPAEATVDSYYAKLISLNVRTHYSTRGKKLGLED